LCHPEQREGSAGIFALAFVVVFVLAFLSVIPEGDLLLPSVPEAGVRHQINQNY
jgi:hypothetical protein